MKVLYLGLTPPASTADREIIHYPVISISPVSPNATDIVNALNHFSSYTHVLFTSKTSVKLLCEAMAFHGLASAILSLKCIVAVGTATASEAQSRGIHVSTIACQETAEGVVQELEKETLDNAHAFWPKASQARTVLIDFFEHRNIPLTQCVLYHTKLCKPSVVPDLARIDEIFFSSPSTVDGFLAIFGSLPTNKKLSTQGPITQAYLSSIMCGL